MKGSRRSPVLPDGGARRPVSPAALPRTRDDRSATYRVVRGQHLANTDGHCHTGTFCGG